MLIKIRSVNESKKSSDWTGYNNTKPLYSLRKYGHKLKSGKFIHLAYNWTAADAKSHSDFKKFEPIIYLNSQLILICLCY